MNASSHLGAMLPPIDALPASPPAPSPHSPPESGRACFSSCLKEALGPPEPRTGRRQERPTLSQPNSSHPRSRSKAESSDSSESTDPTDRTDRTDQPDSSATAVQLGDWVAYCLCPSPLPVAEPTLPQPEPAAASPEQGSTSLEPVQSAREIPTSPQAMAASAKSPLTGPDVQALSPGLALTAQGDQAPVVPASAAAPAAPGSAAGPAPATPAAPSPSASQVPPLSFLESLTPTDQLASPAMPPAAPAAQASPAPALPSVPLVASVPSSAAEELAASASQLFPSEAPVLPPTGSSKKDFSKISTGQALVDWPVQVEGQNDSTSPLPAGWNALEGGAAAALAQGTESRGAALQTSALQADGIAAAPRQLQMKSSPKENQLAALQAKGLPEGQAASVLPGKVLGLEPLKPAKEAPLDLSRLEVGEVRLAALADNSTTVESPKSAPVARLYQDILHEASIVRRLQPDSLAVVLKPDSKTEIFMRLELRDGRLEASARCDRGDFQNLNAHWPELRRSLQHQGVRLMDLQERPEGLTFNTGSSPEGSSQQRRQAFSQEQLTPAPLATAERGRRAAPASARSNPKALPTKHLLESWA